MELLILRDIRGPHPTLGKMFVESEYECFTLEDRIRAEKIRGKTAIPEGRFQVLLRDEDTPMNLRYREFYGTDFHWGMLWFQDVPNFQWVYIHKGNTEDDTDGCPLVGKTRNEQKFTIGASRIAYDPFYLKVREAARDKKLWVTVRNAIK